MTAKEYLRQLQVLDVKIKQKLDEYRQLHAQVDARGMDVSGERVQTTPSNPMEKFIIRYLDLEEDVCELMRQYAEAKDEIINVIHMISGKQAAQYIRILYDHYVPDEKGKVKSLEQIAYEMSYNYTYTCELHGRALISLEEVLRTLTAPFGC